MPKKETKKRFRRWPALLLVLSLLPLFPLGATADPTRDSDHTTDQEWPGGDSSADQNQPLLPGPTSASTQPPTSETSETTTSSLLTASSIPVSVPTSVTTVVPSIDTTQTPTNSINPTPVCTTESNNSQYFSGSIFDRTIVTGKPVSFSLPQLTSGSATYLLSPELPAGIIRIFDQVSGITAHTLPQTQYLWTATLADGTCHTITFSLKSEPNEVTGFNEQVHKTNVLTDTNLNIVLPTPDRGNAPFTYHLADNRRNRIVPPLQLNPTGRLTGRLNSSYRQTTLLKNPVFTVAFSVDDADGESTLVYLLIEVSPPSGLSWENYVHAAREASLIRWQVGEEINYELPRAYAEGSNGSNSFTYSFSHPLPPGINLVGNRLVGSPERSGTYTNTLFATDEAGVRISLDVNTFVEPPFSLEDQTIVMRRAIYSNTALNIPVGFHRSYTRSFSPTLPSWAGINDYVLSGSPDREAVGRHEFTQTVTDSIGSSTSASLVIIVEDNDVPTFADDAFIGTVQVREQVPFAFRAPVATGGDGSLDYLLTSSLPRSEVRLENRTTPETGAAELYVVGEIAERFPTLRPITISAVDQDGDTASIEFNLEVEPNTRPMIPHIRDITVDTGQTVNQTLPSASGGDDPISYQLTPELPSGLSLNERVISGTPTEPITRRYTWTATDVDGDSGQFSFLMTIEDPSSSVPTFRSDGFRTEFLMREGSYTQINLPWAAGGNGSLTYSLRGLPSGLSYTPSTISGRPQVSMPRTRLTLEVTDADGDHAQFHFWLRVREDRRPTFDAVTPIGDLVFKEGRSVSINLPHAIGGDPPVAHHIVNAAASLPPGLTLRGNTLRGTPLGPMNKKSYVWFACDIDSDIVNMNFTITVEEGSLPVFSDIVDSQHWIQNRYGTLNLPDARGVDLPLTFDLTPELPDGLTRTGHLVSGVPTQAMSDTTYTWSVTDSDGDTVTTEFNWEIERSLPVFSDNVDSQHWIQNRYGTLNLPDARGVDLPLTFDLTPELPDGLTRTGHLVSGVPTQAMSDTTYTWSVTDSDGDTVTTEFNWEIEADVAPAFSESTGPDYIFRPGSKMVIILPSAFEGNGYSTYRMDRKLPVGVYLRQYFSTRRLEGSFSAPMAKTRYSWIATDRDGDTARYSFTVQVNPNQFPVFSERSKTVQWRIGEPVNLQLPTAIGGDGEITYGIHRLPDGLTLDRQSKTISGIPINGEGANTLTWSAIDADGDRDNLQIFYTMLPPIHTWSEDIGDLVFHVGTPVNIALPTLTGPFPPYMYFFTNPQLPAGLTLQDHEITGIPTEATESSDYMMWAKGVYHAATLKYTITVLGDSRPTFTENLPVQNWRVGVPAELVLPTAVGGDAPLTYSLDLSSVNLPTGVSFDGVNTISGTPTAPLVLTEFVWTATDADGDTADHVFSIAVGDDTDPQFSPSSESVRWEIGSRVSLSLPSATGGEGSLSYELTGQLPVGVSRIGFVLVGTPTETIPATTLRWTATDSDGDVGVYTISLTESLDLSPSFGSAEVSDLTWLEGASIDFSLPAAGGGNGDLVYSLSPVLPAGVSRSGRVLSGAPISPQPATEFIWEARDADGDSVFLAFDIVVLADLAPTFGSVSVEDQIWKANRLVSLTLPTASGGNGDLSYRLVGELPEGVSLSGGEISGTPTTYQSATTYTWTVADTDGDTASLSFSITIAEDLTPSFVPVGIEDQTWRESSSVVLSLPNATGGDGELSYSLSGDLPVGVTRDEFVVSGTPTAAQIATEMVWIATDEDGDTDSVAFSITVEVDRLPTFGTITVEDQSWKQNSPVELTLPEASDGDGQLSYELEGDLPTGITRSGFIVSGTPTASQAATDMTWTVTDEDGDSESVSFAITVDPDLSPSFGAVTVDDQSWRQNSPVELTLPVASGGDGVLSYELTGVLPAGVAVDGFTVSGSPTVVYAATEVVWMVRDADGDIDSVSFVITVFVDSLPSFGVEAVVDQVWTENLPVELVLPSASGGDGSLSYQLSGSLPSGVTRTNSILSGIPTSGQPATSFVWTVTDADGDAASLEFSVTVDPDLVPGFGSDTVADQIWKQNGAVELVLPAGSGGDGVLAYELGGVLPAGVTLSGFVVSGTPTVVQAATVLDWVVTDADGDVATLSFTVTVTDDLTPGFSDTVDPQVWRVGTPVELVLPSASGGDGDLTYALDLTSVSLPVGVSFDGVDTLSGTPTAVFEATSFVWVATDADGDVANLSFEVSVTPDTTPQFSESSETLSWEVGEEVSWVLPSASGGEGTLSYSLEGQLPAGVSRSDFNIGGLPTDTIPPTSFRWVATDADGDIGVYTFDITESLDLSPSFGNVEIASQAWLEGDLVDFSLPTASDGNGEISYSLTPGLPDGLVLVNLHLRGTPTTPGAPVEYSWEALDADGDSAVLTFDIEILVDLLPAFDVTSIADQEWRENRPISLNLPTASGGNGNLAYRFEGNLPEGVTRTGNEVSGTPTVPQSGVSYVWTVSDFDGDTESISFEIVVLADLVPSFPAITIEAQVWRAGSEVNLDLPNASGGDGALSYSLSGVLPAGVSRSGSVISGTPSTPTAAADLVWTVTDEDGDTDSVSFSVTVLADRQPSFGSVLVAGQVWKQNEPVDLTLPLASDGDGNLTYSLSGTLPDGVTRTHATISGTPSSSMAVTSYVWTVTDEDGDTDSLTFSVTVDPDLVPSFGSAVIADQSLKVDAPFSLTLPAGSGGDGGLSYDLSGSLPAGLTFDVNSRVLSGTPTTATASESLVWMVSDSDGDSDSLSFMIVVLPDLVPSFGDVVIPFQTWHSGNRVSFELPGASGGDGVLVYSLSPVLPQGLVRVGRTISGVPDDIVNNIDYIWTATDDDGDSASVSFGVQIQPPPDSNPTDFTVNWWVGDSIWMRLGTGPDVRPGWRFVLEPMNPGDVVPGFLTLEDFVVYGEATAGFLGSYAVRSSNVRWYAVNPDGVRVAEKTFTWILWPDTKPWFGRGPDNMVWIVREDIGAGPFGTIWLPSALGGDGELTYELVGELPEGVTYSYDVGVGAWKLSGIPTSYVLDWRELVWRVSDSDQLHHRDTAELRFSIKVVADQVPDFGEVLARRTQVWTVGQNLSGGFLPTGFGGNNHDGYTYSVAPDLPAGITFNYRTAELSGTPRSSEVGRRLYRWTVTDSDNVNPDSFTIDLDITILPADGVAVVGDVFSSGIRSAAARDSVVEPSTEVVAGDDDPAVLIEEDLGIPVFVDGSDSSHQDNIGKLANMGITKGCNPPYNTRFCPDRIVSRGEMATFLVRALSLPATSQDLFNDDDASSHESSINSLAAAGLTAGCNPPENTRFCPETSVTRAQMATFLARGLRLDSPQSANFADIDGSSHSAHIAAILGAGITQGCNPPENTRYCPDRPVTRAEMATFLIRALAFIDVTRSSS